MLITEAERIIFNALPKETEIGGVCRTVSIVAATEESDECDINSGEARALYITVYYGGEDGYVFWDGVSTDGVTVDEGEVDAIIDVTKEKMAELEDRAFASGDVKEFFLALAKDADEDLQNQLTELESGLSLSLKRAIALSVTALFILIGFIILAIIK